MISHIQICPNSYSTSTTKQKPPRGFHIHISSGEKKKAEKKTKRTPVYRRGIPVPVKQKETAAGES